MVYVNVPRNMQLTDLVYRLLTVKKSERWNLPRSSTEQL